MHGMHPGKMLCQGFGAKLGLMVVSQRWVGQRGTKLCLSCWEIKGNVLNYSLSSLAAVCI